MTNVFIRKQNQAHEHRFVMAVPKQKSARNAVCGGRQSGLGCVGDCHQLIPMLVKILINNPCHPHKKNPDIRVTQVRIMTRSPDYQRDGITLYLGDCGELLPQMEPGAIGAVITSPPYNLGGRADSRRVAAFESGVCSRDRPLSGATVAPVRPQRNSQSRPKRTASAMLGNRSHTERGVLNGHNCR